MIDCNSFGGGLGLAIGKNGGGFCIYFGAGLGKQAYFLAGV